MNRNADPNHLTARADGRFVKRVRGQLHVFGDGSGNRDAALREWLAVKDDVLAGRAVGRARVAGGESAVTLGDVRDHFLTACAIRVRDGSLRGGTCADYADACRSFVKTLGKGRDPLTLEPDDFAAARAAWAKTLGPWALDRHTQAVRTMFNWAVDVARILPGAPWYGDAFSKTPAADKRRIAREKAAARGEPVFSRADIGKILAAADLPLRAMIRLALNGGMYARDVAALRKSEFKKDGRFFVVDLDRGKTGIAWKFVCWPETAADVQAALAARPKPRKPEWDELVFITLHGRPWHRESVKFSGAKFDGSAETNAVSQEFDKLLGRLGLKRPGVGFGKLRHTYVSAIDDHPDRNAARRSRGHELPGIEAHYRKITVQHLHSVATLARQRLIFVSRSKAPNAKAASAARASVESPRGRRRRAAGAASP